MSIKNYIVSLFVLVCTFILLSCNKQVNQNPVLQYSADWEIVYGIIYDKMENSANVKLDNGRKVQISFDKTLSYSIGDRVKIYYQNNKFIKVEIIQ